MKNTVLLLNGGHCCAKTTIAENLANEKPDLVHLSTGNILAKFKGERDVYDKSERTIEAIQAAGDLVTPAMTSDLIVRYVKESELDCTSGLALDGYPRSPDQVDTLGWLLYRLGLQDRSERNVIGFHIIVDEEARRQRLATSIQNGERKGRADNGAHDSRERVYKEQIIPGLERFAQRYQLHHIDGNDCHETEKWGSEIVTSHILEFLSSGNVTPFVPPEQVPKLKNVA